MSLWEHFILIVKLLLVKPAEIMETISGVRMLLRTDSLVIGSVAKQYGPFRLHKTENILKSGRIVDSPDYFVVVGELAVPLTIAMHTGDKDPDGWTRLVRRREGPFRHCVHVCDPSVKESTYHDLYDDIDSVLKWKRTVLECYGDQLAAARNVSTGNPRRAKFYRKKVAELEVEYRIVNNAFRAFLEEYPDAAVRSKRTAISARRETWRVQRLAQSGIRTINKHLK